MRGATSRWPSTDAGISAHQIRLYFKRNASAMTMRIPDIWGAPSDYL